MLIPPKYSLTSQIIDLLTQIEANRIFFSSMEIPKEVKTKIQRVSLLKSSLFSARIEGNPLTLADIEHTSDTRKKREVTNILRAISFVNQEIKEKTKITEKKLLMLHSLTMDKLRPDAGKLRTEMTGIFNQAGVVVYMPPPPDQIHNQMEKLLTYINSNTENNALICSLVSHLIFEKVHPFLDGNGRVGRLLIFMICKSRGWEFPVLVPVEEYIDNHKDGYYHHLDVGLKDTEAYIQFMLEAFLSTTESLKAEILASTSQKATLLLSPRQEELYNIVKDHGTVSFDFIHRRFLKVPARTLRYDLKKLHEKNLILKIGQTRGSYYKIK